MLNLLPKADKDAIRREYRMRLATVALWFLFATLLAASLLLVPSLFLSFKKEEIALRRFNSFSNSVSEEEAARLEKELLGASGKLAQLHTKENEPHFHELFLRIAALASPRLSISSFSAARLSNAEYRADIGGIARDRAALVAFQRVLEKFPEFTEVTLPLSNLAKDADIEFSISARGAP